MSTIDDPDLHKALRALGYTNAEIIMIKDLAKHASNMAFKASLDVVHLAPENLQPVLGLIALTEMQSKAAAHVNSLADKLKGVLGQQSL